MGAVKATENVYYVGVPDKELKVFDIIMKTERGTTYNAFIVRGRDKTVLFETVKDKFYAEFIANIEEVCEPSEIDYIVASHTEPDHSGCLAKLLAITQSATVVGSNTAINFLKEILNEPFPSLVVTEKDTIDIGGMTLQFFNVPMLHWPDTIFTYIPEIKALFSCDCFGCHYADDNIFNDKIPNMASFEPAYKYYFDNIMGPYKTPNMVNALDKIKNLDIQFIGNGHGPVLRTHIDKYIRFYREWCDPLPKDHKNAVIVFVSAYGYTASLACAVETGLRAGGVSDITTYDLVTDSMDAARAAVAAADAMLVGSPTLVGDALPPIYEVLVGLNPVIHKGKFAAAFGCYGWSGEAVHNITTRLEQLRMNLPLPGLRIKFKPSEKELAEAEKFGADFAAALLEQ